VKEFQWRTNHSGTDLWLSFLEIFGDVCTWIRNGEIDEDQVWDSLNWDTSPFEKASQKLEKFRVMKLPSAAMDDLEGDNDVCNSDTDEEFQEEVEVDYWVCRGCDTIMKPHSKYYHKSICSYYVNNPSRIRKHKDSRCTCCVPHHFHNTFEKVMIRNLTE